MDGDQTTKTVNNVSTRFHVNHVVMQAKTWEAAVKAIQL